MISHARLGGAGVASSWHTRAAGRRDRVSLAACALASLALLCFASAAVAMTVSTTNDEASPVTNGACSLREAILAVNAGTNSADCGPVAGGGTTTITVPAGHYELGAGQLTIAAGANLAIVGANANAPAQTMIDAKGHSRVFEVAAAAVASLAAVEVTGGQTANGPDSAAPLHSGGFGGDGGGILNHGNLTLEHTLVTLNFTGHGGRGIDGELAGSTTRNPSSGGSGGSGGGIYNDYNSSLTVIASTISGNGTGDGGIGGNGPMGRQGQGMNVYADGADGGDGGPSGDGAGLYNAGSATITTTTVSGNFTGRGGQGGSGGNGASETPTSGSGTGGNGGNGGTSGLGFNAETGNPTYELPHGTVGGGGGIINAVSSGTLNMTASTISGNSTGAGGNGGSAGVGGQWETGQFSDGGQGGWGGGGGLGAGFLSVGHGATLTNVTITGNQTGDGGKGADNGADSLGGGPGGFGGYGGGIWTRGASNIDELVLTDVTIAKNFLGASGPGGSSPVFNGIPGGRGKGAGIAVGQRQEFNGYGVFLKNTLIAENGFGGSGDANCIEYYHGQYEDFYDFGNNLDYPADGTCPGVNTNPLLGALLDNGGPTQTMLPATGSPAIGVVPSGSCGSAQDQRGYTRPGGGKAGCDIGAVETGGAPGAAQTGTSLLSSANPSTPGQAVTLTATVSPAPDGGSVSFSDGGTAIPGCESVTVSLGQASCPQTYLAAGSHSLVASYLGDSAFAGSTSSTLTQVIQTPGGGGGGGGGGGSGGGGSGAAAGGGAAGADGGAAGAGGSAVGQVGIGTAKVKGTTATVPLTCTGPAGSSCALKLTLSILEGGKPRALGALQRGKTKAKKVTVGSAAATLAAGETKSVPVSLNGRGKKALSKAHKLSVALTVSESGVAAALTRSLRFKASG